MRKVRILVLGGDIEVVTSALGVLDVMHLSQAEADPEGLKLKGLSTEGEVRRWRELLGRIEHIGRMLRVEVGGAQRPEGGFHEPDRIEGDVLRLEDELNVSLAEQAALSAHAVELRDLIEQVKSFAGLPLALDRLGDYSFLHFALGALPERRMKSLQAEIGSRALLVPIGEIDKAAAGDRQRVLAVSSKKGRWALETALREHGFAGETFRGKLPGMPDELLSAAQVKLDEAETTLRQMEAELDRKGRHEGGLLAGWHYRIRIAIRMAEAAGHFASSESVSLIVGWVPADRVNAVHEKMLEATRDRAVVEVFNPDEHPEEFKDVPTLFEHSRWLKPFELLVVGFGTPGYNEVEPTILVAVTFLFMFGAMFGDVGHGLVLVAAGLLVWGYSSKPTGKQLGSLVAMAGSAGVAGGFVYGSFFGRSSVAGLAVPRLWAEPLEHAETLLTVMVGLGVVMISLGLVLNVVNRIRSRDVAGTLLDRFGVVGILFYWGAIGLALRAVVGGKSSWWFALGVLGPLLVLMVFADVLMGLFRGRGAQDDPEREKASLVMRLFEGMIGTLEACLSYLTNTISFVRVGAFALAHAGFCLAVFEINRLVEGLPGGPVWSVLVLLTGHAVIVALEGLVVSIQAMRLEYYEFFSKFFRGGGKEYQPFGLE